MTFFEILGQILGIIVTVLCIVVTQFPKRWQILVGNAVANICSAANMFLIGDSPTATITAVLPCVVAVIHCTYTAYTAKKELTPHTFEKVFFSLLYLAAWGVGFTISTLAGTASALDLLPLLATAFFVASVFMPRERNMRLCLLGNATIYIIYNAILFNSAIFAHIFTVASILLALFRYREKKTANGRKNS